MLEYDFVICYKKGIDNTAADALSRNVYSTPTDKFITTMSDDSGDIISAQDNDDFIQDVKAFVKKGTLPCHTVGYRKGRFHRQWDCLDMDEASHSFTLFCPPYPGCFEEDRLGRGSRRICRWTQWQESDGGSIGACLLVARHSL